MDHSKKRYNIGEVAELGLSPRPGAPFYSYFTCRHEDRASGGPRYILELCLPVER